MVTKKKRAPNKAELKEAQSKVTAGFLATPIHESPESLAVNTMRYAYTRTKARDEALAPLVGEDKKLAIRSMLHDRIQFAVPILTDLVSAAHQTSVASGFWDKECKTTASQKLLLIVSEVTEAMDVLRNSKEGDMFFGQSEYHAGIAPIRKHYDHEDQYHFIEELCDIVIRVLDLVGACDHEGEQFTHILMEKLIKNTTRPHRHNKAF